MVSPDIKIAPIVVDRIIPDSNNNKVIVAIDYSDYRNLKKNQPVRLTGIPIGQFLGIVQSACAGYGEAISDLKYCQLMANYPYANGVYIFFTRNEEGNVEYKYVGKTTSRAIIDRIGSHLDLRASGLLNCMVKRMASGCNTLKNPCAINGRMEEVSFLNELLAYRLLYIPVFENFCQRSSEYIHYTERFEYYLIHNIAGQNNKPTNNR